MGNSNSSKSAGRNGDQPAMPINIPQQPPYNGLPILYHHMIIEATLDVSARLSFFTPDVSIASTNVDQYYPTLAALYDQGMLYIFFIKTVS